MNGNALPDEVVSMANSVFGEAVNAVSSAGKNL